MSPTATRHGPRARTSGEPATRGFASTRVMVTAFVVATLGLTLWLYGSVPPFTSYRWFLLGRTPDDPDRVLIPGDLAATQLPFGLGDGGVGLVVGVAALVVGGASCLAGARERSTLRIHRWDYFFVLVGALSALALVTILLETGRRQLVWHVLWLAVVAVSVCYVTATTLVRLRAGTLARTIFWPRVFRTLPPGQIAGMGVLVVVVTATALLLGGAVWCIAEVVTASAFGSAFFANWTGWWLVTVGLPLVTLAVVAVLCRNIIEITEANEAAVEARFREERFRAELVTNVTHDIRTPLTSVIAYADLIARLDIDDDRLADYTAVLSRKAERLRVLIGDLLDASRASAGSLPVHREVLDLAEMLGQIVGDHDDDLAARDLTWVGPDAGPAGEPGRGRALVTADGEHLRRILENLLGNVVKYARPGTTVRASIDRPAERSGVVRLRLANVMARRLAVPAAELVGQFTRGDAARTGDGSGLGLFIADRLTALLGGRLTLDADDETFVATLDLPGPGALQQGRRAAGSSG
ncbi:MAG: hypothetical protein BGO96_13725 [Micrococcales bacterium 73-15]|uniref:sensor histidine kinase n=1 Tax=Salana multivorans TaxID=120377 RepID=UPI000969C9A2|nr:HAMP domain-containing sensor histidine kinase [Salana multivorans]OJX97952.1 MAG: hypothetical protein BGO96_13725 [Micrococcales bacterium 73-15]